MYQFNLKKIKAGVILSFILIFTTTFGALNKEKSLPFELDHAVFIAENGSGNLEIYVNLYRSVISWNLEEGGRNQGGFDMLFEIQMGGQKIFEQNLVLNDYCTDPKSISSNQLIPEILSLNIPSGEFELKVTVTDKNSGLKGSKTELVTVLPATNKLQISDIEFASKIQKTQTANKFSKYNLYDVFPDAQHMYSPEKKEITVFAEIYNLTKEKLKKNRYNVQFSVIDLSDKTIKAFDDRVYDSPGKFALLIDKLEVGKLKAGIYKLQLKITDLNNSESISKTEKFYVKNNLENQSLEDMLAEEFQYISEEELDSIYAILKPLMSSTELNMYKKSNKSGKKNVILGFWQKRDPNPRTMVNEYKTDIEEKIFYANQTFNSRSKPGAILDRGKILLKYGYPTDVSKYYATITTKPFEIWSYDGIDGGVLFVFVDWNHDRTFRLAHSNMRGELYEPNWLYSSTFGDSGSEDIIEELLLEYRFR